MGGPFGSRVTVMLGSTDSTEMLKKFAIEASGSIETSRCSARDADAPTFKEGAQSTKGTPAAKPKLASTSENPPRSWPVTLALKLVLLPELARSTWKGPSLVR